jgi:putative glycosyltransferase
MSNAPAFSVSVVTSMYLSARFLNDFHARCTAAAERLTDSYEIIFVNDGSPDDSLQVALELHARDRRVRIIDLSRNFGHHKALMTGLAHARGDMVFLIDCDLEEDPAWLLTFHDALRASGADVIYGVQEQRKGGWFERTAGQLFFSVFNRMLTHPIPMNVITARLMTARYVKALVSHREREICLAGLWAITGFDQRPYTVHKGSRAGASSYTTRKRLSTLANAVTSFSNRPLVYIFQIGMAVMVLSVAAGAMLFYKSMTGEIGVPGWASIMVSIWFLGGLIIFCVGVIGMYLAKMFTEIKQRPYTIVQAEYGVGRDQPL